MEDTNSEWVSFEDYAALKRRHQDVLDAIERTGGLDNIRRVEVSQPVVIDMARENAFLKGENAGLKAEVERLRKAGDAMADAAYAHCMCQDCEELRDQWRDAKRGDQP